MRTLLPVDYVIMACYILLTLSIGLYFSKRAGKDSNHYFVGGRTMPWWLLGTSMAATNFSADTPLAITKFVYQEGIAGVWFFWASAIQAILATFFFARLWRRSEMITDNQLVEFRYGGRSATFLRLFKGFYFGILMNSLIMGWVFKGIIKIMTGVTTLDTTQVVVIFTLIVIINTIASGIYAALWADFVQYYIAVTGTVVLAFFSVREAGGISTMITTLDEMYSGSGIMNFTPTWPQADQWMPISVFLTYIGIKWWSHKFADGGGKHIQRMLSARTETDSVMASFFYTFMNFVIQVWPWIMTALAALVIFGRDLKDPEMAYPMMIAKVLPHGFLGLMLVACAAAFMSTTSTHVNLGSAYMVNDMYRRFLVKNASEKHYVLAARIATLISLLIAIGMALSMNSIGDMWKLSIELTAGAGLTWILRWFWWRINAWTEISAMCTSFLMTILIEIYFKSWLYSHKLAAIVSVSMAVWITVTLLTKPVDEDLLKQFVSKVRPSRLGWRRIYSQINIKPDFPLGSALVNFFVGLVFLYCLNFGIGNLLLQKFSNGFQQLVVALICFVYLLWKINRKSMNPNQEAVPLPAEA